MANVHEVKMQKDIIGRMSEKGILAKLFRSSNPEFLAIYGRRRIGKTFLIRNFFETDKNSDDIYFEVTGQKDAPLRTQLSNFSDAFSRFLVSQCEIKESKNWNQALNMLANEIDRRKIKGKCILFFDEIPWLASRKSGFLQALDYFWNSWASRKKNIVLIVCGSAASWMIRNVLHHKGGLHNRVTAKMRLLPFTLSETCAYLKSKKITLEQKQIVDLYLCIGGVPHYLNQIERGESPAQAIDRICFTKDGFLVDEFDKLFVSLFEHSDGYIQVIAALAKKRAGLTRNEILKNCQLETGGSITKILEGLEESGFIARYIPFDKKSNDAIYRLIDEYSFFYLTWIKKAPGRIFVTKPSGYWLQMTQSSRAWSAWVGYAFEGICHKHDKEIKHGLGISGMSSNTSSWYYKPKQNNERGTQIDMLIDRADNCISLCEIKYTNTEFVITKSYADELKNKRDQLKRITGTKKNIFIALITPHGLKENNYSQSLVDQQLTMNVLFPHDK